MSRILHVAHLLPPESNTGVETYTAAVARAQAESGHTVAVWARGLRTDMGAGWEERDETEGFLRVRAHFGPGHQFGYQRFRPEMTDRFRRFVREWQPDVVHFQHLLYHSLDYPAVARAEGIGALVLTLHDLWYTCPVVQRVDFRGELCQRDPGRVCLPCIWNGRRARIVPRETIARLTSLPVAAPLLDIVPETRDLIGWTEGTRKCLRAVDLIISPSRFVADDLGRHGVHPDRVVITDYGIAPPASGVPVVQVAPVVAEAAGQPLRFGVIGTHRLKGVAVAVDAFRQLTDLPVRLLWYGGGAAIDDLPTNAEAMGSFTSEDRESVYASFDVLIVPSIWWENAPIVIREAFARGKPVVATDLGGMVESVRDEIDGLRFPLGNATALADKIRRLTEEPGLLARLRSGVRAPKFLPEHIAELDALYAQAAKSRANGVPSDQGAEP